MKRRGMCLQFGEEGDVSNAGKYKGSAEADSILHVRIPTYQKELIRAAAEKKGMSLSEFVIKHAGAAASKVMGSK